MTRLSFISLAFLVLTVRSATASSGWICDESLVSYDGEKPTFTIDHTLEKYVAKGKNIETLPHPDKPAPRPQQDSAILPPMTTPPDFPQTWNIIENNSTGLIGVQTESEIATLTSKVSIWTDVLLIDKLDLNMKEFDGSVENAEHYVTTGVCKSF